MTSRSSLPHHEHTFDAWPGDFVYIPAGALHVIANASPTEEASLIFCYIGVGNTAASGTVNLPELHQRFVS